MKIPKQQLSVNGYELICITESDGFAIENRGILSGDLSKNVELANLLLADGQKKMVDKGNYPKSINEIAKDIHENAVAHGWWEDDRSVAEIVALCHSELSESLEAYRNGEELVWDNNGKPDGIAVELIDCVIRIFDYLAKEKVDIEEIIRIKHEYNKTRPYKHGGKKI